MEQQEEKKKCCCICHKMTGILIALIGVAFLLGALEVMSAKAVGITWPILLILIGLKGACCGKGKCKCCSEK